jgi:hypothetical protein
MLLRRDKPNFGLRWRMTWRAAVRLYVSIPSHVPFPLTPALSPKERENSAGVEVLFTI